MGSELKRVATIAASASLSNIIGVGRRLVTGIEMPSGWTTADLTFTGASPGGTHNPILDSDGNELTVSAAASKFVSLTSAEMDLLSGAAEIKVRSGTSGSPVVQVAARDLKLVLK